VIRALDKTFPEILASKKISPACRFSLATFDVSAESVESLNGICRVNIPSRRIHMRFLSIYKTPERSTPPTQEEMSNMGKMVEESMKSGRLLSTEGCMPTALGARIRIDSGKISVSDGPFTEAKEVVGGFAILNASSKEEAIQYTREFLEFMGVGECELRQLYDAEVAPCTVDHQQEAAAR